MLGPWPASITSARGRAPQTPFPRVSIHPPRCFMSFFVQTDHLPSDQIRPSLHLPSEYKPDHLNISRVTFIFWTITFIYYLRPPPLVRSKVQIKTHLPSDQIRQSLHLPSKYEPNHLYISRVIVIFWTAIFISYLRPPLVRSKVQIKTHLPSDQVRQSLHLPSKYEPNHLYISRVIVIFWTAIFISYLRPPLVRSKVQTITHLPSNKNQTLISRVSIPRDLNPKMGGCVSPRGREPGGRLGHWPSPYITLARGQVAPPAPSPVVTHALPSLD